MKIIFRFQPASLTLPAIFFLVRLKILRLAPPSPLFGNFAPAVFFSRLQQIVMSPLQKFELANFFRRRKIAGESAKVFLAPLQIFNRFFFKIGIHRKNYVAAISNGQANQTAIKYHLKLSRLLFRLRRTSRFSECLFSVRRKSTLPPDVRGQ